MTANVGTAMVGVEVDRRALENDLAKAGKAGGQKLGKSTSDSFKSTLVGLGIGAAVTSSLAEADEAIKVAARTESVLRSTRGQAGVTADGVKNLADSLSDLAAVDNDVIQSGENVLLTFTKVRNVGADRIFDQATEAALNMSAALGADLQGTILQVGKALNDPVKGITALSRAGVSFTEQQKEQIRTLSESGRVVEAQKIILAELAVEFDGAAESMATDSARATLALKDVQESVGTALAPALHVTAVGLGAVATGFGKLPPPVQAATLLAAAGAGVWARYGDKLEGAGRGALSFGRRALASTRYADKFGDSVLSGATSLTKLQQGAVLGAAAVGSIVAVYQAVTSEIEKSNQRVDDALGRVQAMGNTDTYQGITDQLENLEAQYQTTYKVLEDEANKVLPNPFVMDEGTEILEGLQAQYDKLKQQRSEVDRLAKRYGLTRDEVVKYGSEHAIVMAKVKEATERDGLPPVGRLRTQIEEATAALDPLKAEFDKVFGFGLDPQAAAIDVVESQRALQDSLRENGNSFDIQTEAGRENRKAYLEGKQSILDYAKALMDSGVPLDEVKRKTNDLIRDLGNSATAAGATEGQVAALNHELGLTPERVAVAFSVPGLDEALTKAQQLNAELFLATEMSRQEAENAARDRRLREDYGITDNGGDLTPHGGGRRSGVTVHGNVYVDAKDKPASEVGREIDRAAVRRMIR